MSTRAKRDRRIDEAREWGGGMWRGRCPSRRAALGMEAGRPRRTGAGREVLAQQILSTRPMQRGGGRKATVRDLRLTRAQSAWSDMDRARDQSLVRDDGKHKTEEEPRRQGSRPTGRGEEGGKAQDKVGDKRVVGSVNKTGYGGLRWDARGTRVPGVERRVQAGVSFYSPGKGSERKRVA